MQLLWPEHVTPLPTLGKALPIDGLEQLEDAVRDLPAGDARHQHLKEQALAYTPGCSTRACCWASLRQRACSFR